MSRISSIKYIPLSEKYKPFSVSELVTNVLLTNNISISNNFSLKHNVENILGNRNLTDLKFVLYFDYLKYCMR